MREAPGGKMIKIKSSREIALMREAGKIAAGALKLAGSLSNPGVSTKMIDTRVREYIMKNGANPSFLGYQDFPASACISVNNEVIHGIPSPDVVLAEGDLVKIDIGAYYKGFHGDCAESFYCGGREAMSEQALRLADVTRRCLSEALKKAAVGFRVGDISSAIQITAENAGYSPVRKFIGHGVGASLHEQPEIPNFGRAGKGPRLFPGMTLAIEPMINAGTCDVIILGDKWTVVTKDGALSAHYEHTVLITEDEPEILTCT